MKRTNQGSLWEFTELMPRKYIASCLVQFVVSTYKESPDLSRMKHSGLYLKEVDSKPSEEVWLILF